MKELEGRKWKTRYEEAVGKLEEYREGIEEIRRREEITALKKELEIEREEKQFDFFVVLLFSQFSQSFSLWGHYRG